MTNSKKALEAILGSLEQAEGIPCWNSDGFRRESLRKCQVMLLHSLDLRGYVFARQHD